MGRLAEEDEAGVADAVKQRVQVGGVGERAGQSGVSSSSSLGGWPASRSVMSVRPPAVVLCRFG